MRPSTRLATLQGDELTTTAKRRSADTSKLLHQLKGDLDWIVMKCLEKDRTRRYETANGLAADLKRHLNNEPVIARPPSAAYRFQKALRRNKLVFAAGRRWSSPWCWVSQSARGRPSVRPARKRGAQARIEAEQARIAAEGEKRNALTSLGEARRTAYLADMPSVEQALRNNNISRARHILNQHRPRPGEKDLREWEWFYFERLAWADDSEVIGTHPGGARGLLSAGGDTFVTASKGKIQVWDGARRRLLASYATPEEATATAAALSRDGRRLAIARPLEIEIRSLDGSFEVVKVLTSWQRGRTDARIDTMQFVDGDTRLAIGGRGDGYTPPLPAYLCGYSNGCQHSSRHQGRDQWCRHSGSFKRRSSARRHGERKQCHDLASARRRNHLSRHN